MATVPWKASLHGGHSGEFCEHASGTLRQSLEAAVAAGFDTYGVSEHAPRAESRFLYASEREKGYSVDRLEQEFQAYAAESRRLKAEFRDRLTVLRGFETEAVPTNRYAALMQDLRKRHGFDYLVGSVHHVNEVSVDESPELFRASVQTSGGLEPFFEQYYDLVREMILTLRPEIVAHLDLPKLFAPPGSDLATSRIRRAAEGAIAAAKTCNCILDLNTAGWRKRLDEPYPAPWLVRMAAGLGIGFCFGDDSHGPAQVGCGLDRARDYLLANGVSTITILAQQGPKLARRTVPLSPQ